MNDAYHHHHADRSVEWNSNKSKQSNRRCFARKITAHLVLCKHAQSFQSIHVGSIYNILACSHPQTNRELRIYPTRRVHHHFLTGYLEALLCCCVASGGRECTVEFQRFFFLSLCAESPKVEHKQKVACLCNYEWKSPEYTKRVCAITRHKMKTFILKLKLLSTRSLARSLACLFLLGAKTNAHRARS